MDATDTKSEGTTDSLGHWLPFLQTAPDALNRFLEKANAFFLVVCQKISESRGHRCLDGGRVWDWTGVAA